MAHNGSDSETILNKGREPRGLGLTTLSGWATDYFDLHGALRHLFSARPCHAMRAF